MKNNSRQNIEDAEYPFNAHRAKYEKGRKEEKMDEHEFIQKRTAYMNENHANYLAEVIKIGFMESYPEKPESTIDSMTIETKCYGFNVKFNVRYVKLTFGKKNEYEIHGIITDRVDIGKHLFMGGWASHCYHEEAEAMELAVVQMAKKHNLMINQKICSWPLAKSMVSEITEPYARNYTPGPAPVPHNQGAANSPRFEYIRSLKL